MIDLDPLVLIFREAWHRADAEGRSGERVADGLRAVFDHLAEADA